jgi:hypothetical protein
VIDIGGDTRIALTCPRCFRPLSVGLGPLVIDEDGDLAVDTSVAARALALHLRTGCSGLRGT